jgi:ABC-2 type transport system permease protein
MYMRKYIEISKIIFKAQLVWRFDIAFHMLFTITKILFAYILWGAIFGEKNEVAGFTYNTMLSYYIISSFLSQLDMSNGVSGEISARIRDGSFSKYMVIPSQVLGNFIARTVGASAFYMLFNLAAALVWTVIFRIRLVLTADPAVIVSAVIMLVLGLLFMIQLNFLLGILAFKFQDIGFFLMIKEMMVAFITGTMMPLSLLPPGIQEGMRLFPFYYVTYLPSMLLVGKNHDEIASGLISLSVWVLLFIPINRMAYNRLRIRYDGVGI